MVSEQVEALLDSTPEIRHENGETTEILSIDTSLSAAKEEEKEKHLECIEHLVRIEPLSTPNQSNDREVSTEAQSFIAIHFETLHEPQASVLQCLKEPSSDKFVKDLCTQGHKSRNHLPKKILQSKQVGYLRWRNILPKGYQILKKKGWKGLVGHPMIGESAVTFLFHFIFRTFSFSHFSFHLCLFLLFLTAIDLVMCVSV
jgi:hypothetical protein